MGVDDDIADQASIATVVAVLNFVYHHGQLLIDVVSSSLQDGLIESAGLARAGCLKSAPADFLADSAGKRQGDEQRNKP